MKFLRKVFFKILEFLITSDRQKIQEPIIHSTQLSLGQFNYSKKSLQNLHTTNKKLQNLFNIVISKVDCTILEGQRGKVRQDMLFEKEKTKVKYPNSKHNRFPSMAIDVAPYPIDWDNEKRFYEFANIVFKEAKKLNIKIKWGGNWQTFKDYVHWEIED